MRRENVDYIMGTYQGVHALDMINHAFLPYLYHVYVKTICTIVVEQKLELNQMWSEVKYF